MAEDPNDRLVMGKLVRDYKTLQQLNRTADELYLEMDDLLKKLATRESFSIQEEEQISGWFFAMLNLHKTYQKIAQTWTQLAGEKNLNPKQKEKALNVSFASFIEWYRVATYLNQKPAANKRVRKKMNEAVPEFGLPANECTRVLGTLGDLDLREKLDEGFFDIWKIIEKEKTTERPFQKRMKTGYDYIAANAPEALKIKVKTWLKNVGNKVFDGYYKVNVAVSSWVGDNKYRPRKPSITYDRVREMYSQLKPGDILLERENWFLSNIFLPGFWKHGIVYVGTIDDIKRLGLDKNPIVARHLPEYTTPDHLGHTKRILEAISEGVVMNSMEEATDADYICAFRPKLTEEQIKAAIVTAFSHLGKPYDFQFNFQTADKIVCTELVYRAFAGSLTLNLHKNIGQWSITADDMLRKFIAERTDKNRELDFIFFLDSDPRTQKTAFRDEQALCESIKRPSIDIFLKSGEFSRQQ